MRLADVLLVAALRGVARGLTVPEVDELVQAIKRLPVGELAHDAALAAYEAAAVAIRRRDLRADHVAELRRLATRLAQHVERLNTPQPNGRALAAKSRSRRGDDD